MKRVYEKEFFGRKLKIELGEMAKQADSSVLVRYGDTVVLTTVCYEDDANLLSDFFPLQVIYNEKQYAVGKIPGGFFKREGRPTEMATLNARMIDRPLRPLFPEGLRNSVQIVNTVLSVDPDNDPALAALFGSSLAVSLSELPFDGPVAGVKVSYKDDKFIVNPSVKDSEDSLIDLTVAGTFDGINMVESSASELSETKMLEALMLAHKEIKKLIKFEEEIVKECGKEKLDFEMLNVSDDIKEDIDKLSKELDKALRIKEKNEKYQAIKNLYDNKIEEIKEKNKHLPEEELNELVVKYKNTFEKLEYSLFRNIIVNEKIRPDGREMDEIRKLTCNVDLLPRVHGSAMFTRGETQSLSITTLGALNEHQVLDGLGIEDNKRFMLHYNFPQFSVGEVGRYGSPNRREVGHGSLGEKALARVIPDEDVFPYTIRVVSETLESNGSSSQASICAGCMSLMSAGVPIKSPVAGIAMGLITAGDKYTILTDIQGMEDHLGDMDFKVAGTRNGICALQMDIKIRDVSESVLKEALKEAKKARNKILDEMEKAIKEPRKELSPYAPKMLTFNIKEDKIKEVIGKGGETITNIILEASNVKSVNDKDALKIDIDDFGKVILYHKDKDILEKGKKMIDDITRELEMGKTYDAEVIEVLDFGCIVKFWEGQEGLVHISKMSKKRLEKVSDLVKVGDTVKVVPKGYDRKGNPELFFKDVLRSSKEK